MKFTGERYTPNLEMKEMAYDHWHRYLFAADFAVGKVVLDVASGEGFGADCLASKAATVLGVDIDESSVRHAAGAYQRPNLEFRCGAADAIPVDGSHVFDLIVSFETIEHLDTTQQAGFLGEIKRLLKPDGVAIVSTPNKRLYSPDNHIWNPYHLHEFDESEFGDFFRPHFRNVQILGLQLYASSNIWPLAASSSPLREHEIKYSHGRWEPAIRDEKQPYDLLAVCSDSDIADAPRSLLLDLTPKATSFDHRQMTLRQIQGMVHLKLLGIRSRIVKRLSPVFRGGKR